MWCGGLQRLPLIIEGLGGKQASQESKKRSMEEHSQFMEKAPNQSLRLFRALMQPASIEILSSGPHVSTEYAWEGNEERKHFKSYTLVFRQADFRFFLQCQLAMIPDTHISDS